MQKIFLVIEKYFTIRVEKNFIRKILVDDIVFKLKTFSYIKTFFSNIVSSVEIKAVSEVKKNVLVSIIKLCIKTLYPSALVVIKFCTGIKTKFKEFSEGNMNKTKFTEDS